MGWAHGLGLKGNSLSLFFNRLRFLSGGYSVCLLTLLLCFGLAIPALANEAEEDEFDGYEVTVDDEPFWVAWNAYISELVQQELATPDPWESFNRKMFAFNDVADRYILTPVAKSYQWITPDPVERSVGNVFSNLLEIRTITNDLLQLKFLQAASDTGRFVINSTVGLVGIFDVASSLGLEKHDEDFGQTLGYWGVGAGPYLVVPIFGSYTLRDGIGVFPDTYTDYITNLDHVPTRNQLWVFRNVHDRSELFAAEELITGDRYSFIRDAYLQRRAYLVNDGQVEDDFGDDDGWGEGELGWEEDL